MWGRGQEAGPHPGRSVHPLAVVGGRRDAGGGACCRLSRHVSPISLGQRSRNQCLLSSMNIYKEDGTVGGGGGGGGGGGHRSIDPPGANDRLAPPGGEGEEAKIPSPPPSRKKFEWIKSIDSIPQLMILQDPADPATAAPEMDA